MSSLTEKTVDTHLPAQQVPKPRCVEEKQVNLGWCLVQRCTRLKLDIAFGYLVTVFIDTFTICFLSENVVTCLCINLSVKMLSSLNKKSVSYFMLFWEHASSPSHYCK